MQLSIRTVWRYVREGEFVVVRFGARRLRIDTERTLLPKIYNFNRPPLDGPISMAAVIAYWHREDLNERQRVRRRVRAWERRRQQLIADGIRFLVDLLAEPPPPGDLFFRVKEVAHLSGRSIRGVYHDSEKGALSVYKVHTHTGWGSGFVGVMPSRTPISRTRWPRSSRCW
jgi:hypothetical protein